MAGTGAAALMTAGSPAAMLTAGSQAALMAAGSHPALMTAGSGGATFITSQGGPSGVWHFSNSLSLNLLQYNVMKITKFKKKQFLSIYISK